MSRTTMIVDFDFAEPPGERECLAAVWSKGGSCKGCPRDDCYRQGWSARRVTIDNAARVAGNHARMREEGARNV
jgi:hypothetical protein